MLLNRDTVIFGEDTDTGIMKLFERTNAERAGYLSASGPRHRQDVFTAAMVLVLSR